MANHHKLSIIVIIIIPVVVTVLMMLMSSQQLCRDCVLGQFRDKWHSCITGANQDQNKAPYAIILFGESVDSNEE